MCKYRDALNSFGQATDIDPEFNEAWYNKGIALMNLGKNLEAIRAFDKVLKINPHDRRAHDQRDLAQKKIMESCSISQTFPKNQTKLIKCDNTSNLCNFNKVKKIFSLLPDAFEHLFEDIKPFLDVFEALATR